MPPASPHRFLLLATLGAFLPSVGRSQDRPPAPPDSITTAAARAIKSGHPWQATRLLAPYTKDPAARPALILTAARAAAQWEGWATVVRLLDGQKWLDTDGGVGHALLGLALLERNRPADALPHTRRAVELANAVNRGERLVAHARALDRLDQLDSAAAGYRAAAEAVPLLRDWLHLRAAGVTRDSTLRTAMLAGVSLPAARPRIPWTEALARDRASDWAGAAERYAALGAKVTAARLRLQGGDTAVRRAVRAELVTLLGSDLGAEEAQSAIALFDEEFPKHTAAEELRLARRAAVTGQPERAAQGYTAAKRLLTDRDRFSYAAVLARLGKTAQALPLYDAVKAPGLKADAAYQKARLKLRGGGAESAEAALRRIPVRFPRDSEPAAQALFLVADLVVDRGEDDSARALFLRAASKYPGAPFARHAAFQAALIAFLGGSHQAAAEEFDRLAARGGDESLAARYWAGRSWQALGDTVQAAARWREVMERAHDSYYAMRASRRLGVPFRPFVDARDSLPGEAPEEPLVRARRLEELGLRVEARLELDAFVAAAGPTPDRILLHARALADGAWHARALRLSQRAQERGAPFDRTVAELLYPLPFESVLRSEATAASIDPMLAAAVIRQESAFDPSARSVADARGLMQVLPSVGAQLARRTGLPEWDPALLYQPDVNLDFGIDHLAQDLKKLEWPERALAAYNAGYDRVLKWRGIRGIDADPEVFVERIPFAETRDYVRRVTRNRAVYTALYPAAAP